MALKVFDLQCDRGHVFEAWFASHADYDKQQQQGLLSCLLCQSTAISRRPSAARINLGHKASTEKSNSQQTLPVETDIAAQQALWLRRLRAMVHAAHDVGSRFSEEARRMHAGEIEQRTIRGTATAQERAELVEEGIVVMPLPDFLDDDRLQ